MPTVYSHPSPNLAGRFIRTPRGVIIHASRSGIWYGWDTHREFWATVNYCQGGGGPDGLAWNVTIGPGILSEHLPLDGWGWNAREHSREYLAAELSQARVGDPIEDSQVDALAWWIVYRAMERWPNLPLYFPMHSELPAGVRDRKSDLYPRSDPEIVRFLMRLDRAITQLRAVSHQIAK